MSERELARFCRKYREYLGWTQAALAKAADLSIETIQRFEESGICSGDALLRIARAIGADARELVKIKNRMVRSVEKLLRTWYP